MIAERRFLVAPSLARLIQKEQGIAGQVAEGYFPSHRDRCPFVRVEAEACHLVVLTSAGEEAGAEDSAEIPISQAEALLDACAGTIAYDRSRLELDGGREVVLDRFTTPKAADLLTMAFDHSESSQAFHPPRWFGPEVTDEAAYEKRSIAVNGPPQAIAVPLSEAALDALLDDMEKPPSTVSQGSTQHEVHSDFTPQAEHGERVNAVAQSAHRPDILGQKAELTKKRRFPLSPATMRPWMR